MWGENKMANKLYEWFHDDITWCGNECSHIECERNLANRLDKTGLFSAAMFKDTEICPLNNRQKNNACLYGLSMEEENN